MTMQTGCLESATSIRSPGGVEGCGMIIAVGCKPVAVAYRFRTGAGSGSIETATSQGKCDALRAMWLEPTVILRLEDGQHIDISITQCDASKATFEIVGDP